MCCIVFFYYLFVVMIVLILCGVFVLFVYVEIVVQCDLVGDIDCEMVQGSG